MTDTGASKKPPIAALATVGAAIGLCLLVNLDLFRLSAEARANARDPYLVAMQDERFRDLASALPAGGGAGYVSDLGLDSTAGQAAYFTAQYALAPRLLAPAEKTGGGPVVGNFARPPDLAAMGFELVRDYGNGVMLLRRKAR
ncbi:MAG: hypothetical protein R2729_29695 [Bryobacteraceae bacterium]